MKPTRIAITSGAALLAGAALALGGATAALAHTTVGATSSAAGSSTVLTFASGHGCDGSPTTSFAIEIPEGIYAAAPTVLAGWDVEKVFEPLAAPVDNGHGGEYTERVAQIVYTAQTPLEDGYRVAFEVSLQLPADAAGTTLYFPTVQSCEVGENAWIEIPADGQDAEELASPAPALEVTAATGDAHSHGTAPEATAGEHGAADDHAATDAAASPALPIAIAGLVVGAIGLILGLVAVLRRRPTA